nr:Dihydrofolate reductase [uncultured bacterium]
MKIILVAALSADGYIARTSTHGADWTGSADKKLFVKLTKEMGIMVMGSTTFATIGRALPGRRTIVYTTRPETIDVEGIETTNEPPAVLIERLATEGATGVAICGGAQIYTQFMQAGLIQELYLTYIPIIFGQGVALFNAPLDHRLELLASEPIGEDAVLLHYQVYSQP